MLYRERKCFGGSRTSKREEKTPKMNNAQGDHQLLTPQTMQTRWSCFKLRPTSESQVDSGQNRVSQIHRPWNRDRIEHAQGLCQIGSQDLDWRPEAVSNFDFTRPLEPCWKWDRFYGTYDHHWWWKLGFWVRSGNKATKLRMALSWISLSKESSNEQVADQIDVHCVLWFERHCPLRVPTNRTNCQRCLLRWSSQKTEEQGYACPSRDR